MLRHIWTLIVLLLHLTTPVFAGEISFTASSDIAEGSVLFFDYTTESGTTQELSLPTATSTAAGAITYRLSAKKAGRLFNGTLKSGHTFDLTIPKKYDKRVFSLVATDTQGATKTLKFTVLVSRVPTFDKSDYCFENRIGFASDYRLPSPNIEGRTRLHAWTIDLETGEKKTIFRNGKAEKDRRLTGPDNTPVKEMYISGNGRRVYFREHKGEPLKGKLKYHAFDATFTDIRQARVAGALAECTIHLTLKENQPPRWGSPENVKPVALKDTVFKHDPRAETDQGMRLPRAYDPDKNPGPAAIRYYLIRDQGSEKANRKWVETFSWSRRSEWDNAAIAPPGMSYSRSSLGISGSPTEKGSWTYIWAAMDNWRHNTILSEPFTITVE